MKAISNVTRVGFSSPKVPKVQPAAEVPAPEQEDPEVQKAISEWRRRRSIGSSRSTTLLTGGGGLGGFTDTNKKRLLGE